MNSPLKESLNEFLKNERKWVFEPGPYFVQRVMARLKAQPSRSGGIWEIVPSATRPVFGLALVLLMAFVAIQVFVPVEPSHGLFEAALGDQPTGERFLYSERADVPTSDELLSVFEVGQ